MILQYSPHSTLHNQPRKGTPMPGQFVRFIAEMSPKVAEALEDAKRRFNLDNDAVLHLLAAIVAALLNAFDQRQEVIIRDPLTGKKLGIINIAAGAIKIKTEQARRRRTEREQQPVEPQPVLQPA